MARPTRPNARPDKAATGDPVSKTEAQMFDSLPLFIQAVEEASGLSFDFQSVTQVNTSFVQGSDQYLVLNVRDYNLEQPNNLLFLTEDNAFLYSATPPPPDVFKPFEGVLRKPFAKSTVLAFLTLDKVLDNYKAQMEGFVGTSRELEAAFDYKKYRDLAFELERLDDRLEEFHDLLLNLEERHVKQVDTQLISFDYGVLIAECLSLQGRCRRRLSIVKDLARDHEMQATVELTHRIERLNNVMKRLTALTVLLMLPTLVASHFGMNFRLMPELDLRWAYPAVIAFQVVLIAAGVVVFRKIGWL